jgi:hypothetical protein
VLANPFYKLVHVRPPCTLGAKTTGDLKIGPKDLTAQTLGATTQVNVSMPFVDIGRNDDKNLLLHGKWRNASRRNLFALAVRVANGFVDATGMGDVPIYDAANNVVGWDPSARSLRKVRSLLTLFFYNGLAHVRHADSSTVNPAAAEKAINKDNFDWLPKITLRDALDLILKESAPTVPNLLFMVPGETQARKETDLECMLRVANNEASFNAAFTTAMNTIRADLRVSRRAVVMRYYEPQFRDKLLKLLKNDPKAFVDTKTFGNSWTGKPLPPIAPVDGHKASHYMVVFEIRSGGDTHALFKILPVG